LPTIGQKRHDIVDSLKLDRNPASGKIVFRFPRMKSGRLPAAGKPSSGINGLIVAAPGRPVKSMVHQRLQLLTLCHK
jgi:hypothetical protein